MIKAIKGQSGAGMVRPFRSPPDLNGAVRSLTAPTVPGPGVCTPPTRKRVKLAPANQLVLDLGEPSGQAQAVACPLGLSSVPTIKGV